MPQYEVIMISVVLAIAALQFAERCTQLQNRSYLMKMLLLWDGLLHYHSIGKLASEIYIAPILYRQGMNTFHFC